MSKIRFAMALHFHQPIGNFEGIFERAYKLCYKPFLELLSHYPELKMMFHISGCLLDYFEKKHPEIISLIIKMVKSGQIEIMGGGYYEPILTAVPRRDAIGQIKMMSAYIEKRFGVAPRGAWVAERVWRPDLAKLLHKAGVRYLVLDDEHFLRSGVKEDDIHGYFLTGSSKEKVAVFPSSKKLRYMIPFKVPQETIDYLGSLAGRGNCALLTYGDDGEKFGEWPGTHDWVFGQRWLANFFDALKHNKHWIELVHFSEYLKDHKPKGTLTVHEGSYEEMMEWAGGPWLNFLDKYPEADQMHKKMHYVSAKLEKAEGTAAPKNAKLLETAKKELYKGECNCAYWHGVFGGLYLYHLRKAVYNHLIESDKIIDDVFNKDKSKWLNVRMLDFDMDGRDEVIAENKTLFLCIDAAEGGVVKELDYRPLSLNVINTLSRKKEAYHKKILESTEQAGNSKVATIHDDFRTVDPAFKKVLAYDKFARYFLRSYFIKDNPELDGSANFSFKELGDFSAGAYEANIKNKNIILERKSKVQDAVISLTKEISIRDEEKIEISCIVRKKDKDKPAALLGLEFNLTMPDLNSERYLYSFDKKTQKDLNAQGRAHPDRSFGIRDSRDEFSIYFSMSKKPASILYFPVKTVSQSERAYELNYQCSCIFPVWKLDFDKNNEYNINLTISFKG